MKLTENHFKNMSTRPFSWGKELKLKHKYKNEVAGEVKTYTWSKEEMDKHLKKLGIGR